MSQEWTATVHHVFDENMDPVEYAERVSILAKAWGAFVKEFKATNPGIEISPTMVFSNGRAVPAYAVATNGVTKVRGRPGRKPRMQVPVQPLAGGAVEDGDE